MNINNDVIVNRSKREAFFKMKKSHYHTEYEIYYLFSGERKFFINDSIYYINKGDIVIIPKGTIHRTTYSSDKTHERTFVYFSEQYLKPLFEEYGKEEVLNCFSYPIIKIPNIRREYVENLLKKLEYEYKYKDRYSDRLIENYIQELIIFLIRYKRHESSNITVNIDKTDEVIQKAARYILNNYNMDITLNHISKYVNMSSSYFSKRFKESTGFGFKEYLINVRIKNASDFLLETKDSITEIAFKCGFNDSNYFGDVFKKIKGVSPIRYRKRNTL